MSESEDGFVLYHGSYCEVREPDLARCAKRKDFGQGFYLTTSKEQAESFLRTSIVKEIATGKIEEGQNFGYVSTFEFQPVGKLEMHVLKMRMWIGYIVSPLIERKNCLLMLNVKWQNMISLQERLQTMRQMQLLRHILQGLLGQPVIRKQTIFALNGCCRIN